ncbi:hypothetical protein F2Q70_00012140 [Brassica cretica]|uniref:Uncharacterized protein n=1 Tax=Brassica cretica TaxID=69181 RepID=A0A8S9LZ26_BRACR|nr:hypothetical protein F2Q70_00012140 [Brassica cretica]
MLHGGAADDDDDDDRVLKQGEFKKASLHHASLLRSTRDLPIASRVEEQGNVVLDSFSLEGLDLWVGSEWRRVERNSFSWGFDSSYPAGSDVLLLVHEVLFGLLLTTTSTCGRGLGVNNGGLGVSSGGLDFVSGGLDFVNGSLARWRRLNKLYCVVFLAGGVGLKDEETEGAEVDGEGDEVDGKNFRFRVNLFN